MKQASDTLKQFLENTQTLWMADLYTITLSGGTVLRYTGADHGVTANGLYFTCGPGIQDQGMKQQVGVQTDQMTIEIHGDLTILVGTTQLIDLIRGKGLDNALIKVERAFAASPTSEIVGTAIRFSGRFSEVQEAGQTKVEIVASSGLETLQVNVPTDVYQTSCINTLGDARCTVNRENFKATGSVIAGGGTTTNFQTSLQTTVGIYSLGTIIFDEETANAGIRSTIMTQDVNGNLVLSRPLPAPPNDGDTFVAYQGDDLSQATCNGKFNNLIHFKGTPYIPVPETAY